MFIYKAEKEEMQRSITYLLGEFSKLWSEYLYLKAKIKVLEGNKPVKQTKTPAQKAKQAEYMRKYTARKRAEKLAQATA